MEVTNAQRASGIAPTRNGLKPLRSRHGTKVLHGKLSVTALLALSLIFRKLTRHVPSSAFLAIATRPTKRFESPSRCVANPCRAFPVGLLIVPETPRMPERSSVAVTMTVASSPSCTCGGLNSMDMSCGGVESEFGSFDFSVCLSVACCCCELPWDWSTDFCGCGLFVAEVFGEALAAFGFDNVRGFAIGASGRAIAIQSFVRHSARK